MIRRVAICVAACVLSTACGRDALLRCENAEAYLNAEERPPIRVPDDLTVPNQGEALRIPPAEQVPGRVRNTPNGPCLESPPDFYEGLGDVSEDAAPAI